MLLVGRSASWAPVSISTIEELWLLSVISDTDELILSREMFFPPGPDSSEENESPAALLLLLPLVDMWTFFCEADGTGEEPSLRLSLDLAFLTSSASTSSLEDEVARVLFERRALPSLPSSAVWLKSNLLVRPSNRQDAMQSLAIERIFESGYSQPPSPTQPALLAYAS